MRIQRSSALAGLGDATLMRCVRAVGQSQGNATTTFIGTAPAGGDS